MLKNLKLKLSSCKSYNLKSKEGIDYNTCKKYLNQNVENDKYSKEFVAEIKGNTLVQKFKMKKSY